MACGFPAANLHSSNTGSIDAMTIPEGQRIVLYYAPDNASLIVRLLLVELELPYRTILVDRSVNAQKSAKYLELNPAGLIPVCIINDEPVFETGAILLTLADDHDRFTINVRDARRGQFLKWLFFLSNALHVDLRQRFYPDKFAGDDTAALRAFSEITLQRLIERFGIFDSHYCKSADPYLFGIEPTIVDMYLAVCFRWAQLYPQKQQSIDREKEFPAGSYKGVTEMVKQLEQRPSIRQACAKEGITGRFFSAPEFADPPEGVAL